MKADSCIGRKGLVEEVCNGYVTVKVSPDPACSSCLAKNSCTGGVKNNLMNIPISHQQWTVGEEVILSLSTRNGFRAVWYGYILPLILLLGTLLFAYLSGLAELMAGIASIAIPAGYYGLLYVFRKRLGQTFLISISKL